MIRFRPYLDRAAYCAQVWIFQPVSLILALIFRFIKPEKDVIHISAMVHIPYYTVDLLRSHGLNADYLAIGNNPCWNQCDFHYQKPTLRAKRAFWEFYWLWFRLIRYKIIHCHFMKLPSESWWEAKWIKLSGRKIVTHYRGCEIRDWKALVNRYPNINICSKCDYRRRLCTGILLEKRRKEAAKWSDLELVTTPDLLQFAAKAVHLPFFIPPDQKILDRCDLEKPSDRFVIVFASNHPGIEGLEHIQKSIENLKATGLNIEFNHLEGVNHDHVLRALKRAHLSIGKMKMGYYANAQVESLALGVPVVTFIRKEFQTQALEHSGLILTDLDHLEETLRDYIENPEKLKQKSDLAKVTAKQHHDPHKITEALLSLYREM